MVSQIGDVQYWTTDDHRCLKQYDTSTGEYTGYCFLSDLPGFDTFEREYNRIFDAFAKDPLYDGGPLDAVSECMSAHRTEVWYLSVAKFLRDVHELQFKQSFARDALLQAGFTLEETFDLIHLKE